jgi:hypothetical protein
MNRKLLAFLIAASILVGGKPFTALAQTDEPTPETTPVVVESEPVVIPDDSTVIVVEAPEPEPAPVPSIDLGLLAAIGGIVLIGFFALFGATVVKLGNSAPPWMVAALVGGVDAIKPSVDKWVATTPTTLDDSTILEVWKEIDKLKRQVGANTEDIQRNQPGK